jgi:energy-converting hydrogenase Eha subunit H
MRRSLLRLGALLTAAALFGTGFLLGQAHNVGVTRATALGPDFCVYYHDTITLSGGAGTASVITVYAANWDSFWRRWRALYTFEEGISLAFGCEKRYF